MYDKVPPCLHYIPTDHVEPPSCLDSAYERKAIEEGHSFDAANLFPENKMLYMKKHFPEVKEWSYNSETKEFELYIRKKK